jgi:hypothetical protein
MHESCAKSIVRQQLAALLSAGVSSSCGLLLALLLDVHQTSQSQGCLIQWYNISHVVPDQLALLLGSHGHTCYTGDCVVRSVVELQ